MFLINQEDVPSDCLHKVHGVLSNRWEVSSLDGANRPVLEESVKRLIAETARECSSEAQKVQHKEDLAILSGQHARECRKPNRTNGSHAGRPTSKLFWTGFHGWKSPSHYGGQAGRPPTVNH